MNIDEIRSYVLNEVQVKMEPVPVPFWPKLQDDAGNSKVYLRDVPSNDLISLQSLQNAPDGNSLFLGALLCKCLVVKMDDGSVVPMFEDAQRSSVASLGSTILLPIMQQAQKFFGLDAQALDAAKKN